MNKLLFLDTELGGPEQEYSLLTAHFSTFDENFNLLGSLDLKLTPDDGVYHVSAKPGSGIDINKIDLVEHSKTAITYKEGGTKLYNYLQSMYGSEPTSLLTPVGHNVRGDINHIIDKLISKGSFNKFVSYELIDTCSIARFLQFCGKLPCDISCGLNSLKSHFEIKVEGSAHEAKSDVLACVEVFKHLKRLSI